ncbi:MULTISPECIES: DUF2283 domain-containing protein [unclassified Microbacterium]|uniref:DUF2283 domain-containing protein n=1 Tax=unclassified Microbacterium TaxID=2609290 RepID=UPI000D50D306|nr:DUF2283 domain-containing protein [Microbacterium sp. TPD7012]PVE98019.1 hypothetical protein DC434_00680 [Microbacterium sp. TPD7012]
MKITYDAEADAAYISIVERIGAGDAVQQVSFIDTPNGESQLNLDFDAAGRLLGVEVLVASKALASEVLASAAAPGDVE